MVAYAYISPWHIPLPDRCLSPRGAAQRSPAESGYFSQIPRDVPQVGRVCAGGERQSWRATRCFPVCLRDVLAVLHRTWRHGFQSRSRVPSLFVVPHSISQPLCDTCHNWPATAAHSLAGPVCCTRDLSGTSGSSSRNGAERLVFSGTSCHLSQPLVWPARPLDRTPGE